MRTLTITLATLALLVPVSLVAAQTTSPDAQFVQEAAIGNLAEVELGRLAVQRGTNPGVKQFGQRMVTDHGAAQAELMQIAQGRGMALPAEPDAAHRAIRDRLAQLAGPAFDREYMAEMLRDHQQDIADFQREAQSGQDPAIRAWAAKTLPTLQQHLAMAQTTHSQVAQAAVGSSPSASVVTTTTIVAVSPWCGGAYASTAGTNFGSCPGPAQ